LTPLDLKTYQRCLGISCSRDLLTVNGNLKKPGEVNRKVRAVKPKVLAKAAVPE
jgi:hypothetical protein